MRLGDLLPRAMPALDWLQVEVSTHTVGSGGAYSIQAAHRDRWITAHFPMDLYRTLRPAMERMAMVHLQGWGDPLRHPQFLDMVAMAKQASCRVTTATCPELAQDDVLEELVRLQLDSLTFPMAALDEKRNLDRRGTSLHTMFRALDALRRIKARQGSEKPRVIVLYTLMRPALDPAFGLEGRPPDGEPYAPSNDPLDRDELARLPAALEGHGVDALIVNPLSFTARREHQDMTLVPANEEAYRRTKHRLDMAVRDAGQRGMAMHYFLAHGGKQDLRCIENPKAAAFVDVAGNVAPCVFSALPIDGPASLWFNNREQPLPRLTFGNLTQQSFKAIWHDPAYARFRRNVARSGMPPHCNHCWRPYMVPA